MFNASWTCESAALAYDFPCVDNPAYQAAGAAGRILSPRRDRSKHRRRCSGWEVLSPVRAMQGVMPVSFKCTHASQCATPVRSLRRGAGVRTQRRLWFLNSTHLLGCHAGDYDGLLAGARDAWSWKGVVLLGDGFPSWGHLTANHLRGQQCPGSKSGLQCREVRSQVIGMSVYGNATLSPTHRPKTLANPSTNPSTNCTQTSPSDDVVVVPALYCRSTVENG